LQDLKRQQGIRAHESGEVFAGEIAKLGAGMGDCGERVRFIADQAGKSQQRTSGGLEGEDLGACGCGHGKRGRTGLENVEARRRVSLTKEDTIFVARDGRGLAVQTLDELRICDKRGWVEIHLRPPGMKTRGTGTAMRTGMGFMVCWL